MSISVQRFGKLEDGREASLYTLSNSNGVIARITNYGGIITSLTAPDRDGNVEDIVLGFDNLQAYLEGHPYFGAVVGRMGNRIADGRFRLDGKEYKLAKNEGENHLHGGIKGFDKVLWSAEITGESSLKLKYLSPDGEEGYPGNLEVTLTYTLTDQDELKIEFDMVTDKATPVNPITHSYFNLGGDPSRDILNHQIRIHADAFTPVNDQLIPTGEVMSVEGTPYDFREFQRIDSRMDQAGEGYDLNYVLRDEVQAGKVQSEEKQVSEVKVAESQFSEAQDAVVKDKLKLAAELAEPETGRYLKLYTTEPAMQFYSGNYLDGSHISPAGIPYRRHSGLCLEPQHYPNSPNIPAFPSTILRPGKRFHSRTVYALSVIKYL